MSIIYDALKKIEGIQHKGMKEIAAGPSSRKPKPYLLAVLAVCILAFAANIFYGRVSGVAKPVIQENLPGPLPVPAITPLPEEPPIESKTGDIEEEAPPELVLSGIFFSGNEGYALINERIMREGDEINGAVVTKILIDGVELEFKGKAIKLATPAK